MFRKKFKNIHFIGIGGSGMSGIAEVLLNLEFNVSGSDLKVTDVTKRLSRLGADIKIGHKKSNIENKNIDVVVTSTAVIKDNPEVLAAISQKIPVIPRAEMLAELMRLKYSIAIAGCHGKTTTTSMASLILANAGLDPTVVIGGRFNNFGTGAKLGKGEYLVAEADESDGSFLKLFPTFAVVTNIDDDHLDYYGSLENIKSAFVEFINKIPFYGCAILCNDDENLKSIIHKISRKYYTYGFNDSADFKAENIKPTIMGSRFDVSFHSKKLGTIELKVPGRHNILNALASIICGYELEIKFSKIRNALLEFSGVGRRLEKRGSYKNVLFLDDYGHHPTEIKATLSAIRSINMHRRLFVLFQPHRYTRTQLLKDKFGKVFDDADVIRILDIYAASEKPIPGISSQTIIDSIRTNNGSKDLTKFSDIKNTVKEIKDGDVIVTLGAGDIWKKGDEILKILNENKPF
ncbi:MAG: UDP-N-acetylmuramate--L-alanine ligase [Elusimicrobia bacterium RIFOXYC2_FULL_34_12]|nr:MAG: UDP-N-acetylmuramate--L-alanine ligase [Elusimicrobia bacterium RIFOXYC2_FULL_34_12]